jgi:methylglutaconyl-CoA hydratase
MQYTTIEVDKNNDILTVTLNRPEVHNAMNELLMKELTNCFTQVSKDSSIRVVILTGNGKSFCAGADLNWMKSMVSYSKEENIKDSRLLVNLYDSIYFCPKMVIGKINGHAFGGGIGLIAVCDITIAPPDLLFAFSEANLGIIPSVISTYVSPRIRPADMRRLFITAERFNSTVAHEIGLIDYVVKQEELAEKVDFYIKQCKSSGPIAINEIKKLIHNLQQTPLEKYKEFTVEKISDLRVSKEGQEGINAFLEKRKPTWREKSV